MAEKKPRGRPRKVASQLTTEEALKKIFPAKAIQAAKDEVAKADKPRKQATKE